MEKHFQSRKGAALVVVILAMIAAGIVGTAILSKVTSARFERVQFSVTNRAYYLAESGAAYVRARADTELDYPPPKATPLSPTPSPTATSSS